MRLYRPLLLWPRGIVSMIFSQGNVAAGLIALLLIATLVPSALAQSATVQATTTPTQQTEEYTVRVGDSWSVIAERVGLTTRQLKALNPNAVRPGDVLRLGEKLLVPAQPTEVAVQYQEYVVRSGDSWSTIAEKFDVSMRELLRANPSHVRGDLLLVRGITLKIPLPAGSEAAAAATAGTATSTPVAVAAAATATQPAPTENPVNTPTETATPPPVTPTPTLPAAEEITATATSSAQTATTEATGGEPSAGGSEATETLPAGCPPTFEAYPEIILEEINAPNADPDRLSTYLTNCGALRADSFTSEDWNGDGAPEIVLIYQDPAPTGVFTPTDLLILNSGAAGYTVGYQALAAGEVRLLATIDINKDTLPDVAWSDTTCGASTCFDTVHIRSWDGAVWQDWTAENITLPYADIKLADEKPEGQGLEVIMTGGIYGSAGAGPLRNRVEYWGSPNGAPYLLVGRIFDASDCLYFVVLDANDAYLKAAEVGFGAAEQLYTKAYSDQTLKACWPPRPNELDELRSFSLFRLAQIAAYEGLTTEAGDMVLSLSTEFPYSPIAPAAQVWSAALQKTGSIDAACAALVEHADQNPAVVDVLADFGYANPSFSAGDFCPALAIAQPAPLAVANTVTSTTTNSSQSITKTDATTSQVATQPQTATVTKTSVLTTTAAVTTAPVTTAPTTTVTTASTATTATVTTASVAATTTLTASAEASGGVATTAAVASATLAGVGKFACPTDLAQFAEALPAVIEGTRRDSKLIESYMQQCNATTAGRSAVAVGEFNSEPGEDILVLPAIVDEKGFGPDGSQGTVLIFHPDRTGAYTLVLNPELYGLTRFLSSADLNGDKQTDLAWTVAGCTPSADGSDESCVTEVQIVTWDRIVNRYRSLILPGALIAEGTAKFEPVPAGDPGQGQQLWLIGGVSKLPDSGLGVPHSEIWESIRGGAFQRIRWTYDRSTKGNDCVGLRLVEADVALQASPVLGYAEAIGLYKAALDPALKACSIRGMNATDELVLLQGLASFRMMQAQALSGEIEDARATLDNLSKGQPDTFYTQAATAWLLSYSANSDAQAACTATQAIFQNHPELWQITDHYGFNHPVIASEQICYVPQN